MPMSVRFAANRSSVQHSGYMTGFTVTPWEEIEAFYEDLIDNYGLAIVNPMLDLARSVIAEGAARKFAAHTSMHDLVVTTAPVSDTPDWLRISLLRDNQVRIGHQTTTGPGDTIERPVSDLVSLFWRFTIEKWGVRPGRDLL